MDPYWKKNYQDEDLVNNYLESYIDETNDRITKAEVDFIEQQIEPNKNSKIVDVCCANGRHLLEFERRGYTNLTGVDLSPLMLSYISGKSCNINLINTDMRYLGNLHADLLLNLFSSCGFFETDEDNFAFFEAVNRALKIGGIFCLEIVHRESYVKNMLPQEWRESEQYIILKEQTINFETSRYVRKTIYIDKRNNKRSERYSSARIFTIYEVNDWLKKAGFKILRCFDGLKPNDFVPELSEQLCVIAIKEHELPGGYGVKERRGYSKNRTLKQAIEK